MTPRAWNEVREVERKYIARLDEFVSEQQAMRIYEALWIEAKKLGAVDASYARDNLAAKIELVRGLNSLP